MKLFNRKEKDPRSGHGGDVMSEPQEYSSFGFSAQDTNLDDPFKSASDVFSSQESFQPPKPKPVLVGWAVFPLSDDVTVYHKTSTGMSETHLPISKAPSDIKNSIADITDVVDAIGVLDYEDAVGSITTVLEDLLDKLV